MMGDKRWLLVRASSGSLDRLISESGKVTTGTVVRLAVSRWVFL